MITEAYSALRIKVQRKVLSVRQSSVVVVVRGAFKSQSRAQIVKSS